MSESDNSSTTSFGDISVCQDIDQLIESCQQLQEHIDSSFETLKGIQVLVQNHQNIIVTHNGWTGDFDELLERFHQEALNKIKNGESYNFSEIIQDALKIIVFKN
jgi:hypothetical protein